MKFGGYLALIALLACDREEFTREGDASVVLHPADVNVAQSWLDLSGAIWAIGGIKPIADDELQLGGVPQVVELAAGRYFVSERDRVRLFDGRKEVWRHGMMGSGPQDFQGIGWPCRFNSDTVVLLDQRNARIAFVVPGEGTVVTIPSEGMALRNGACNGNGSFLTIAGTSRKVSNQFVGQVWMNVAPPAQPRSVLTFNYYSAGIVGAGSHSIGFVDSLIYVADPNRARIAVYNQRGVLMRTLVLHVEREPVTDESIPRKFHMVPANATEPQLADWWKRIRHRPRLEHWPAFEGVIPDHRGNLWISSTRGEAHREPSWWVVTRAGTLVSHVRVREREGYSRISVVGMTISGVGLSYVDREGALWLAIVPYPY